MIEQYLSVLDLVTRGLGITIFAISIVSAAALVYINRQKRIDLTVPYLSTAPWALVVVGAGALTLGVAGIEGIAIALGAGIFVPVAQKALARYLKNEK